MRINKDLNDTSAQSVDGSALESKTIKELITNKCEEYAIKYPKSRFIGYNTIKGSRMYGTLEKVPHSQCIEMPVSENLMLGMAIGLAIEGYRPVVCFERHDFFLLGFDALINHLDKMPYLSGDQFKLPVIIRAIVGAKEPLDPGPQHTSDYTEALKLVLKHTPVVDKKNPAFGWNLVGDSESGAVVIIERKDQYDEKL